MTHIIDPNDAATFPDGLWLSVSWGGSWTYVHYKGITRAVYPREARDGSITYSIGANGPTWYDVETDFPNRDIAEARAIEMLTRMFVEI